MTVAQAQQYQVDKSASDGLTHYLHRHDLPLVGAQVLRTADGSVKLMLYGYVASDFKRQEAENKAIEYLHSPGIAISDSIQVKPSIAADAAAGSGQPAAAASPEPGSDAEWNKVMQNIYRNGFQAPPKSDAPTLP